MTVPDVTGETLARQVMAGDRRALARAITLVERRDPRCAELLGHAFTATGRARTVGITGPPGVGKSTLVGGLIAAERTRDRSVGVVSVDPSSPFGSGALLGDRLRMGAHAGDPHVFIRSMASRGALGGLARAAGQAAMLMDAAGLGVVLLETVGVGQAEIDVATSTDTVVLVLMPGAGDIIQALKSGIMEVPDVIVVNRARDPRAKAMVRHVHEALSVREGAEWVPPLVQTEATDGRGIDKLHDALSAHRAFLAEDDRLLRRRRRNLDAEIVRIAVAELAERVGDGIYVTRLHYLGVVDPREGIITGMTRDGTFRIEGGRITKPLVNLRFTTSFPKLAEHLVGLSSHVVLVNRSDYYDERYPFGTLVPAV
ncbi:MAG: methylmalonyl Co-A mutase-associated GTPase MeaB, partial [Pseudonocardia sp.]